MAKVKQATVLLNVGGWIDAWMQAVVSTPEEIESRLPVSDPTGAVAFAMATGGLFVPNGVAGRDVPRWEA